ncbi:MAG: hypothetical protein GWO24_20635, partial [Akkermansiaceae bacterium]|nr:hypothetical protein [Akkermansiaceae bacterium]
GGSLLGQEPAEAFFGLGDAASVDQLTVEWPDGSVTTRTNLEANRVFRIGNRRPHPDLAVSREGAGAIAVRWHGGVLEELLPSRGGGDPVWTVVPLPPNPLSVDPSGEPRRLFRVSQEASD